MAAIDQVSLGETTYELVPEIAPLFDNTKEYAIGDYVIKDAALYKFKAAHAAGAWVGTDAEVITVGNELTDLKADLINNLKHLNSYNYLTDYSIKTYGTGVTCSRTSDGGINLSGTCDDLYFVNFYANKTQMPSNLIAGKNYTALFGGENVIFQVYFYKNGSYLVGWDIETTKQFTIPSDATGAIIRLSVKSGTTVNETVYPFIIDNTSLLYKGAITNDFDIGTITETGVYLLDGNTSSPVSYGTLMHLEASQYVRIQILFEMADLKIWYRRWLTGTWDPWQTYGDSGFYSKTEYIAFGDSLTWGALWNGTAENPVITQAPLGSRIPDRIKNAIKCTAYYNYAVGGMAYTIENGSVPKVIDWIKSKDISTADLITIAGGRNDGASSLGTYDSQSGDGTICGAIREIIEYIRETNPSCQIVVIQVTPYTSTNNPFDSRSTSGWTLNTFDEQVSKLCKNMNVGYANWYGCSLFSRWTDFSGGGGNYAHMREAEQYIQMGNFIAGQVARFYQN